MVGDQHRVSTTYAGITNDVRVGDQILLDDGFLTLAVTDVADHEVRTIVVAGGMLKNNKGINLPNVEISAPAITDKDKADLAFGLRLGVDYIALSFVRHPEDIHQARKLATTNDHRVPIIAKIEKPQAIERLSAIVEAADGVMVARGDLGVELGPEKVPMIQKRLINMTNSMGKIVITATQMLESMIRPQPADPRRGVRRRQRGARRFGRADAVGRDRRRHPSDRGGQDDVADHRRGRELADVPRDGLGPRPRHAGLGQRHRQRRGGRGQADEHQGGGGQHQLRRPPPG